MRERGPHHCKWKIERANMRIDRLGQKSGSTCPLTLREQVLLGLEDGLAKAVGVIDKTHQQRAVVWQIGAHVGLNTRVGPNRAQ